ncbi:MAG: DUF2807 domain-containing protein [Bacteroidia bacterium]|nr:DUF2807 domain-containing protein [Bacteroidia bacterium]
MKTRILFIAVFIVSVLAAHLSTAQEERAVPSFSEISLRVPGKLYLKQGPKQSVEIAAKASTLEEIITEVKDRKLIIRFTGRNYLMKTYNPGKIEIFVTVPEVDGLNVSGSGDIEAETEIKTRILDLAVSGSGDIQIDKLNAERVKTNISGSGNILIEGDQTADELSVNISGSGNVKAGNFEAEDVSVTIAGSGNATVNTNGSLKARIAGSGNVYYRGNPNIDSSVAGSGGIKEL